MIQWVLQAEDSKASGLKAQVGCKSQLMAVPYTGHLLHIPVWQKGIVGVPVDGVGHISVGLIGEQVHHTGGGTIITREPNGGISILKTQFTL